MNKKNIYIVPLTEVVDLGLEENVLQMEGTHSVEDYKEQDWTNIGSNDEDDEVILSNRTSLWE